MSLGVILVGSEPQEALVCRAVVGNVPTVGYAHKLDMPSGGVS